MVTRGGPKVLEYNVRFGDPETQPILMRLDTDLLDLLEAVADGKLADMDIRWKKEAAVCVVMAAGGYPGKYEKGKPISGLEKVRGRDDLVVFHAGTSTSGGKVVSAGGRVLGVTALGKDIPDAIANAYKGVDAISFDGMQYRKDIGQKALARL